ncbi:arsenate reductase (glutaredoxin) [Montanilutibacter psychrotolerans]|uniref:Arsenate reductase n=1 Tax=Montanilutibacter psychrotolerans TaxID=1327343 RepID=A0A3M8SR13_9GAMM|nr:arsenate reductase (glutaredoxin) [Lysobacter psychrotolerans]RNF83203.1 arsenate reductase (glutaredoxin) [Lysobacter psychrotolerans]
MNPHPADATAGATTLYHNARCSKSRGALELLRERGIEPQIVHYLDTPLDASQLRALLDLLGLPARDLLRTGETEFAELGLDDRALDDAALIAAMAAHPRLIERPVFVHRGRAVIGRPPERVLDLLD